jgi:hypothetical protein
MAEHLPSKCEALYSNPQTPKQKEEEEIKLYPLGV